MALFPVLFPVWLQDVVIVVVFIVVVVVKFDVVVVHLILFVFWKTFCCYVSYKEGIISPVEGFFEGTI